MKVAVVGSGVSGLGATWLLNEHSDHEVHLYESDDRPGGHANTVHYIPKDCVQPATYPNFIRFLQLTPAQPKSLLSRLSSLSSSSESEDDDGIRIDKTEMTFSISRDYGAFEWAGKNLATIFCQPRRLFDSQMWRMIYDVLRFNASARRVLLTPSREGEREISIGEYLHSEGYSAAFRNNYLIPMTAAIWSTPPDKCFLDFPARTLIQFLYNHHLLQITGKPAWLTIHGGSHKYVDRILHKLPSSQLHLSTPITSVRTLKSEEGGKPQVVLRRADGSEEVFDHVILACHSDTALEILRAGNIQPEEERILSQFQWNHNEAVLHSDENLMPRSRLAWSCWNYLSFTKTVPYASNKSGYISDTDSSDTNDDLYEGVKIQRPQRTVKMEINEVSLTYGMNDLQHIPYSRYGAVLVTLNPPFEPDADKVAGRWKYDHPVLDSKAVKAQNEMYKIQNTRSISYAGAYLKYGFHEDGFTSGLLAACSLDAGQESIPAATSYTSTLKGTTIPTRKDTVRPPLRFSTRITMYD
ncbi:hypothetical protein NLJ89_g5206 [Agrocybe chaxingu]|uniref:Amine oxidase domain-containing protein n=1 Tax=Agrocybe chaxingu TaxID=84603 RepID=A0A9W8K7M7_9AGAR|nr:hypothetical protein NLJ89_g5206 [Agrocybe chaxingu]